MEKPKTKRQLLELIESLKKNPCPDCGQSYDVVCMDFDHIPDRGVKIAGPRYFAMLANEAGLLLELFKGEFVCSNCHRIRTKKRGPTAETRARLRAAAMVAQNKPEQRARLSFLASRNHADPAVKAMYSESISRGWKKRKRS